MNVLPHHDDELFNNGFTVINDIYTAEEIESIIKTINSAEQSNNTFRKTSDLFAIRQFLKEVPGVQPLIFNQKLKSLIAKLFGPGYFVIKSIYFDKPEKSNWLLPGTRT